MVAGGSHLYYNPFLPRWQGLSPSSRKVLPVGLFEAVHLFIRHLEDL